MPIIEDLANPAMRTRHWKQLVRISGGTALIYNDTIKTLTFGQLLDLDLQSNFFMKKLAKKKLESNKLMYYLIFKFIRMKSKCL